MASGGNLVKTQQFTPPAGAPSYLSDALKDIGLQEFVTQGAGKSARRVSNPAVERYIEKVSGSPANAMTTPWCAYFVGAKLEYAGITSTKSGMARSYLKWGQDIADADWRCGDIVVFMRGSHDDHVLGHVAFLLRWDESFVWVVGGNQGDKVCIEAFSRDRILGVRRPRSILTSKTLVSSVGSGTSQVTKVAVDNLVPSVGDPSQLASVAPTTGKMPSPEDLQAAYDQAHPYMTMLSHMKPEIIGLLTLISLGLALYAGWFRYQDWKNGRT